MSFTPLIPAAGQTLGSSRPQVQNNFTNYNDVVSVNHVAPNAPGQGKHKFLQMPVQASATTTASGEGGVYTKTTIGQSIPFYTKDNLAVQFPLIPIRAMVRFTLAGSNGPDPITGTALNVSSVVKNGADHTITFTESMPDTNYLVQVTLDGGGTVSNIVENTGTCVLTLTASVGVEAHVLILHYAV